MLGSQASLKIRLLPAPPPHTEFMKFLSLKFLVRQWCLLLCGFLLICGSSSYAKDIKVDLSDGDVRVSLSYELVLPDALQTLLDSGLPIYFESKIQLKRIGWIWDQHENSWWQATKNLTKSSVGWFGTSQFESIQTQRLNKSVLQGDYRLTAGNFWHSVQLLDQALELIRKPRVQKVVSVSDLQPGAIYEGVAQLLIDQNKLPKPFQLEKLKNDSFTLVSPELYFEFSVPEK